MARTHVQIPEAPLVTTRSFAPLLDGRVQGIDRSVWLWRRVPAGALRDAKNDTEKERLGHRLQMGLQELAQLAQQRALNRQVGKSSYRRVRIAAFNVPVWFEAPHGSPTEELLNSYFHDQSTINRVVMLGVKLHPSTDLTSWQSLWGSVVETFFSEDGVAMSDFDQDAKRVATALRRADLEVPDPRDFAFADSWVNWTGTSQGRRCTPYVAHMDHLHFLRTPNAVRTLRRIGESVDCEQWPDEFRDSSEQVAITFGAVESLDMGDRMVDALDPMASWAANLFENGARSITIEGLVEPASITRKELARNRRKHEADAGEFADIQKRTPQELEEHARKLQQLEDAYALGQAPATLIDTSILVSFDGVLPNLADVTPPGVSIDPMTNASEAAYHEMMLCSSVRANPHRLDVPITAIAYAGLPSLTRVGDPERVGGRFGALAGFTELDRQPVWVNGAPQSIGDQLPLMQIAAATGSGKLLPLDAELVTPSGTVLMGEVRVGDTLVGRDRRPCTVTAVSEVNPNPELFVLELSDGQEVTACRDHQWVVRVPEVWAGAPGGLLTVARILRLLAWSYPTGVRVSVRELASLLTAALPEGVSCVWTVPGALAAVLGLLEVREGDAARMLQALAGRATQLAAEVEGLDVGELVCTTGELRALMVEGRGRWSIRAAAADFAALRVFREMVQQQPPVAVGGGRVGWVCADVEIAGVILRRVRDAGVVARLEGTVVSWSAAAPCEFGIVGVRATRSRPGRCVMVDSPDSTYLCADLVPTHNTQLLLWLAHQWHLIGHPQFILDPKKTSDHSAFVQHFRGQVASLSDLEGSDGALDPLRFSVHVPTGIQLAAEMVQNVNPWGGDAGVRFEADIADAIRYGVEVRGARATGEALGYAQQDGRIDASILEPVWKFANSYPMFAAAFGRGASGDSLSIQDGMTLFMVGDSQFETPPQGDFSTDIRERTGLVRTSANAIRMLVRAATTVLANRSGIIHIDEAWMVELLARGETEQLGRLARQMDVFPILYNQTPSTAINSGVANYVARGFLGYIKDPAEAHAGMKLFGMEGNEEIFHRVVTPRGDAGREGGMNWNSLQHLYAAGGARKVVRGAVFYHSDLNNRVGATEVVLPSEFLRLASSNPEDIRRRKEASGVG